MPQAIVKLWPGKSELQKTRLAEAITKDAMEILRYGHQSVSVAIEDIAFQRCADKMSKSDTQDKADNLHKKPAYDLND